MEPNSKLPLSEDYAVRRRQIAVRVVIAIVAVAILVGIIVLIQRLGSDPPREEIKAHNLNIPAISNNGVATTEQSLTFFNGRNFINYDLAKGSTSQILSDKVYPAVSRVSWSPDGLYAAFYSSEQVASDALGSQLAAQGKSLNESYWWLFDKQAKTVSLISDGQQVRSVAWSGDHNLFAQSFQDIGGEDAPEAPQTTVYTYDLGSKTLNSSAVIKDDVVQTIFPTTSGLFYITPSGREFKLKQIVDNKSQDVALANTAMMSVSPDGSHAYYYRTNLDATGENQEGPDINEDAVVPSGTLTVIEVANIKTVLELPELSAESKFTFSATGGFWALTTNPEGHLNITSYNLSNGQPDVWRRVEGSSTSLPEAIGLTAVNDTVFVQSLRGFNVVGDKAVADHKMPLTLDLPKASSEYQPYIISQSSRNYTLFVTIFGPPAEKYKAEALKQISGLGADPNLFRVEYDTTNLEDPT